MESTQDLRGDRSLQDAEPLAGSLPDSERGLPLCVTAPAPGTVLADWIAERP